MKFRCPIILALAGAALLGFGLTGCDNKAFVLGPYPFEVDITDGVMSPDDFSGQDSGLLAGSIRMDYCGLPTEAMFNDYIRSAVNTVGPTLRAHEARLNHVTITASEGDFRFANAIMLRYIPARRPGRLTVPVILGAAFSPAGFGSSVEVKPTGTIDLLDLIRAQDDHPGNGCPQLEVFVLGTTPSDSVTWSAEAQVDIYVSAGG